LIDVPLEETGGDVEDALCGDQRRATPSEEACDRCLGQVKDIEAKPPPPPPHPHLTPRQSEVLRLLERGRSTEQIATELNLSAETVRNHIRHLMRTLGVHSRIEAVAVAHHEHLLAS
jgi:two-component system NarL family response regulator